MSVTRVFQSFVTSKRAKKRPSTQVGKPLKPITQVNPGYRMIGGSPAPLTLGKGWTLCPLMGWHPDEA